MTSQKFTQGSDCMKAIPRNWLVCGGAMLLMFVSTGLVVNTLTVYLPYLLTEYGLSNAEGSMINTIRCMASLAAMPFVARYYRTFGLFRGAGLAILLAAGSYSLFGMARTFSGFALAAAAAGVAYSLGGIVAATIAIDQWFSTRKGTAMGICSAGSGLSAIFMPPILTRFLETRGVSYTFYAEAGLMILLGIPVLMTFHQQPPAILTGGEEPSSQRSAASSGRMSRGYFWAMLLAMACIGAVGGPGYSHQAVLFSGGGYDSMTIAYAISLNGLLLLVFKCCFGMISDKIGAYRTNFLFGGALIAGFALCCCTALGHPFILFAAQLFLGIGWSICTVGLPVWADDLASPEQHAKTVQDFQTAYSIGALVFSPLPGLLADLTGSYVPSYLLFTAQTVLILGILQRTYRHCAGKEVAL